MVFVVRGEWVLVNVSISYFNSSLSKDPYIHYNNIILLKFLVANTKFLIKILFG